MFVNYILFIDIQSSGSSGIQFSNPHWLSFKSKVDCVRYNFFYDLYCEVVLGMAFGIEVFTYCFFVYVNVV